MSKDFFTIQVYWIEWDTDDNDVSDLPIEAMLTCNDFSIMNSKEEIENFISEELSNKYWFTHYWWESHFVMK